MDLGNKERQGSVDIIEVVVAFSNAHSTHVSFRIARNERINYFLLLLSTTGTRFVCVCVCVYVWVTIVGLS